jgi:hypothetical protein
VHSEKHPWIPRIFFSAAPLLEYMCSEYAAAAYMITEARAPPGLSTTDEIQGLCGREIWSGNTRCVLSLHSIHPTHWFIAPRLNRPTKVAIHAIVCVAVQQSTTRLGAAKHNGHELSGSQGKSRERRAIACATPIPGR